MRTAIWRGVIGALAASVVAVAACSGGPDTFEVADVGDDGTEAEHRFVIPAGTGEAIDGGAQIEIVPADLRVKVGEKLELVNEDDRGHTVGPFFVGAGETLRQEFTAPGVFVGICTVHPSGEVVVTVRE